LTNQLLLEDELIHNLQLKKQDLKQSLTWFFDRYNRFQVDLVQTEINEQNRVVQRIQDQIHLNWLQIKPLYGVFYPMFFVEMFSFIPWSFEIFISIIRFVLLFDLVTFLVLGPVALSFFFIWFSLGLRFFFTLASMILFGVAFFWIFYLPFIIIQYDPSVAEFLIVYIPFVLLYFLTSSFFFGAFGRRSRWRRTDNSTRTFKIE